MRSRKGIRSTAAPPTLLLIPNTPSTASSIVVGQGPTLKRRNTQVSILRRNGTKTSHWRLEVGGREKNNKD